MGFAEFTLDVLVQIGEPFESSVRLRRMFGGYGIFCDGVMFGLIAEAVLFLKVDDTTRASFLEAGADGGDEKLDAAAPSANGVLRME